MILAKIQADSVEDSLLFYSCQSLDGEGDFVSLAIRFAILCVHIIIITIIITRPKPAYGRQGLAGSWGQDLTNLGPLMTMKIHLETLKNHGNQPKTMKNHETTLKNHGNQAKTMKPP